MCCCGFTRCFCQHSDIVNSVVVSFFNVTVVEVDVGGVVVCFVARLVDLVLCWRGICARNAESKDTTKV